MRTILQDIPDGPYQPGVLRRLRQSIERAFDGVFENGGEIVIGQGQRIRLHLSQTFTLNFAAPGAVPGISDQTVTLTGARFGDTVVVASPVTVGANYVPPLGFVSANDSVTIRWWQLTGAAADPDGGGGAYRVDLWRH